MEDKKIGIYIWANHDNLVDFSCALKDPFQMDGRTFHEVVYFDFTRRILSKSNLFYMGEECGRVINRIRIINRDDSLGFYIFNGSHNLCTNPGQKNFELCRYYICGALNGDQLECFTQGIRSVFK